MHFAYSYAESSTASVKTRYTSFGSPPCASTPRFRDSEIGRLVELLGIEPALEIALNCEDTGINDGKVRQSTPKHLGERVSC